MTTVLIIIIVLLAAVAGYLAYLLFQKRKQLERYRGLSDVEAEQQRVQKEVDKLAKERSGIETEVSKLNSQVAELKQRTSDLEIDAEFQEFGLYKPKYDFGSSERYKLRLDDIRAKQKQLVRDKKAVICTTDWSVGGSKAEGRKMTNRQIKLMTRAFNGECDALIQQVKYNNIDRIEKRIVASFDAINKMGEPNKTFITRDYLNLKFEELYLVHEYQEKLQEEREEQRQIREQMREEQKAQKELEKAQRDAEREEERYQKALDQARDELAQASEEKQAALQEKIALLAQQLQEAHEKKERAISQAQLTRSGHVYIISNIGSFGDDVYKIGMTRRLEPLDRVKELGDASVPFQFDIHAMIYSEDAPALETTLHQTFDHRRLNRINLRKEFFKVSLAEIKEVVERNHGEIEFTLVAEAEEYRKTLSLLLESQNGAA